MSDNKRSSQASTQKSKECVIEYKVTDQFMKMINKALDATKGVLKTRKENLKAWTYNDEKEFEGIFGLRGKTDIIINYYTPGQKVNADGEITPSHIKTTAYEFIKSGVDRMIDICDSLIVGNRTDENNNIIYSNFVNLTDRPIGSARIPALQTTHMDLKNHIYKNKSQEEILKLEYQKKITIDILQNFTCKKPTGKASQASTLCHELSHLFTIWDGVQYYGGLSSDDLGKGREIANARDLIDTHDSKVFKNAYNIEKYFEID
ncbi:hypothetical protein PVM12_19915 [Enterobacter soli]|uniref:hypothetical protein n=1 Tax=Enterobacter soli TaxID=885040 RepID=UPI0023795029|nr:hypothetical protein [Enterobacter soli]MDD9246279.1 hypothetical protein [Enterobacter soli]HDR2473209.1 hypothetical protein [Enterobacter soli]